MPTVSQERDLHHSDACTPTTQLKHLASDVGTIISRVPLIVADILLIYITWRASSIQGALADLRRSKRLTLSDVLFRDGTIYFIVLFILNVLHLVLTVTALADVVEGASFVPGFIAPLTAILISRFLLDLQEANQTVVRLDPDDPLHSLENPWDDTPSFISSLGGFINPERTEPVDDELDLHVIPSSESAEASQPEPSSSA
ncbi:hypothetical protein C8T65DRAFT_832232 [Cerioporus squamosus]|nr:hypothetical protein C8T65DRAFT_832232 [Cerioporus squamosus]